MVSRQAADTWECPARIGDAWDALLTRTSGYGAKRLGQSHRLVK